MNFYSIAEVANMSNQSQKTIRRHIASGKLKADKIGNRYRISDENYERWLVSDTDPEKDNIFREAVASNQSSDNVNWVEITDKWPYDGWANRNYRNGYNFIDLFSGAGGLSCGLTMAGFTPVGSVEIMPEAVETYKYNFVSQKGFTENVETRDIKEDKVKKYLYDSVNGKHIHLIVGGFPCQGFSMAGNRVVTDPRNSLYLEMLEIVKHLQPDFVVMENVEGLRSMLNGKVEAKIISDYKEAGYDINVTILNSADYGVPQIRRRVIFVGNRHGLTNYHPRPIYSPEYYVTLGEGIKRFMAIPENKQINHIFTKHSDKMIEQIQQVPEGKSLYGNYSDAWKKSPWDKPSCTIKENHGGVNIHPKLPRVLTPRELAALQSFPDDFIFKGSKKWQLVQIGNAVPPLLGKAIGIAVMKGLDQLKEVNYKRRLDMYATNRDLEISNSIQYILDHYLETGVRVNSSSKVYDCLCRELPKVIKRVLESTGYGRDYLVSGSMGMTNKSDCPWIAIMNRSITNTTQKGLYVAFLFKKDMSGFYLTLNQGMKNYETLYGSRKYENAKKVADYFVSQIDGVSFVYEPIDLGVKKGTRGYGYGKGNVLQKYYSSGLFNDNILKADILEVMSIYDSIAKHMDSSSYSQVIKDVLSETNNHIIGADEAIEAIKSAVDPDDDIPFGYYRQLEEVIPRVDKSDKFKRITQPKSGKIDYIKKAKRDAEAGLLGEELVLNYEKERLTRLGLEEYAEKVGWVSQESDAYGYDIVSYEKGKNGSIRKIMIEVKTTVSKVDTDFFVSKNERDKSIELGKSYCVYRVYDVKSESPKFYRAFGAIEENFILDPVTFRARYKYPIVSC